MTFPNVTAAAAFGVPDRQGIVRLWAAVVGSAAMDGQVLNRLCAERLGPKAPKYILQVPALPRNANGKVMREQLVTWATAQQP